MIHVDNKYYACDEAVWFVAGKATGPWQVATSVPDEIYTIPPESPIYHVTFVRVYNATDDVVYVGYTEGYTNTYVYNTTIVYGTGYWYPGWYGRYYYPRPATWGFHVRWNPGPAGALASATAAGHFTSPSAVADGIVAGGGVRGVTGAIGAGIVMDTGTDAMPVTVPAIVREAAMPHSKICIATSATRPGQRNLPPPPTSMPKRVG